MSANSFEAAANQGQFSSKVPRSEPLTTKGHAPGVKFGNDAAPEFHTQTLPAGTAPSDRTFQPNYTPETSEQDDNGESASESKTSDSDTVSSASSADVHQGHGMPVQGQSSEQLHGSGVTKGTKDGDGGNGVGGDSGDPVKERGLGSDIPKWTSGNRENIVGAEEMEPVSAEALADELS